MQLLRKQCVKLILLIFICLEQFRLDTLLMACFVNWYTDSSTAYSHRTALQSKAYLHSTAYVYIPFFFILCRITELSIKRKKSARDSSISQYWPIRRALENDNVFIYPVQREWPKISGEGYPCGVKKGF